MYEQQGPFQLPAPQDQTVPSYTSPIPETGDGYLSYNNFKDRDVIVEKQVNDNDEGLSELADVTAIIMRERFNDGWNIGSNCEISVYDSFRETRTLVESVPSYVASSDLRPLGVTANSTPTDKYSTSESESQILAPLTTAVDHGTSSDDPSKIFHLMTRSTTIPQCIDFDYDTLNSDSELFPDFFPSDFGPASDMDVSVVSPEGGLNPVEMSPMSGSSISWSDDASLGALSNGSASSAPVPEFKMLFHDRRAGQCAPLYAAVDDLRGSQRDASDDSDASDASDDMTDDDYVPEKITKTTIKTRRTKRRGFVGVQTGKGKRSRRKAPQLWMFLLECLTDGRYNPSLIAWNEKHKGTFKIMDTKKIAKLWGNRSGNTQKKPMNYEKFSRAIRYYYNEKVIISCEGRLTYQFGPNATGWKAVANNMD